MEAPAGTGHLAASGRMETESFFTATFGSGVCMLWTVCREYLAGNCAFPDVSLRGQIGCGNRECSCVRLWATSWSGNCGFPDVGLWAKSWQETTGFLTLACGRRLGQETAGFLTLACG